MNINFGIVKVRCVPRFIVIGIFIVATVRKDIFILSSFFSSIGREREHNSSTCMYIVQEKKNALAQSDLLIGVIILNKIKVWI